MMTAREIYQRLKDKFGEYEDSGLIHSNKKDIKDIVWEIDGVYLYPLMKDPAVLYIVHHPVSRFNLAFEDDKEPDEESENYILEYHAKRLNLNLMCIHSLADKILENELNRYLKDKDEKDIIVNLNKFFNQYINFEFNIYTTKRAEKLLKKNRHIRIENRLATYNYKIRKEVIYIDQLGATKDLERPKNNNAGILVPHSVTDISAMIILEREIRKIMKK